MDKISEIMFRRKSVIDIDSEKLLLQEKDEAVKPLAVAAMKNFQNYGYTPSRELARIMIHCSVEQITALYQRIIELIKYETGADKVYNVMYPDFPNQVLEASDAELFINAIVHYWSAGTLLPDYKPSDRLPLIDTINFTTIDVYDGLFCDNDSCAQPITDLFYNLIYGKTSLSAQDIEDVNEIISCGFIKIDLEKITYKETLALVSKLLFEKESFVGIFGRSYKSVTDVLRLITILSNGDVSLSRPTKFRNFKRSERRKIMNILHSVFVYAYNNDETKMVAEMQRHREQWLRLQEKIHPGELSGKNPQYFYVAKCFRLLSEDRKYSTQQTVVENFIKSGYDSPEKLQLALKTLQKNPGDFARRLDKLIRGFTPYPAIDAFSKVSAKVALPVLLQAQSHFQARKEICTEPVRFFFPKGNIAKVNTIPNNLPEIPDDILLSVIAAIKKGIKGQMSSRSPLGKIYFDPEFKNYLIPFSQRSATSGNKTLVRGSRIPISSGTKTIRGFIWWTNSSERVDLDLSLGIFDECWKIMTHISYTNLHDTRFKMCHSGDIVDGGPIKGKGAAEFIDFDIDAVVERGGRYVVFQVYSFTKQEFIDLPNSSFGWMERQNCNSGEIFEPATVQAKFELNSKSTTSLPVIFDCVEKEFIWCDLNLDLNSAFTNNIENYHTQISAAGYAMTHLHKPTLCDLILASSYRPDTSIVETREEADIIFSNDTTQPLNEDGSAKNIPIITAFDTDYFIGQLL